MSELGLPPPAGTKAQFIKQQNDWYAKLAADGFKDLEWIDRSTGLGQNSDHLKGSVLRSRAWRPEKAQFYRLLRNYATHVPQRFKVDQDIINLLSEGMSYRRILKYINLHRRYRKSLFTLFYRIQGMLEDCIAWNKSSAEGMLNPANQDSWATDVLLADMGLEMQGGELGLPLDYSWFDENLSGYYDKGE